MVDDFGADHYGARVAQELARRLAEAMEAQGYSANRLSRESGCNRQTITNVLTGTVWCDLLTIANLQRTLGIALLPDRPDANPYLPDQVHEEHGHLAAPLGGVDTSD